MAGSARTSAIALLSVLNKKCGRMRDCNSDRRAAVAAGARPLARSTRAATRAAASKAPVLPQATQGACCVSPISTSMAPPYTPASAPSSRPAAYCPTCRRRASHFFRQHATISQTSVAGKAAPVSTDNRSNQSSTADAPNMAPTAITTSTNSTARNTTPAWQASKTSAGPGATGTICGSSS